MLQRGSGTMKGLGVQQSEQMDFDPRFSAMSLQAIGDILWL